MTVNRQEDVITESRLLIIKNVLQIMSVNFQDVSNPPTPNYASKSRSACHNRIIMPVSRQVNVTTELCQSVNLYILGIETKPITYRKYPTKELSNEFI